MNGESIGMSLIQRPTTHAPVQVTGMILGGICNRACLQNITWGLLNQSSFSMGG